jgi:putative PIN family toxin of toxin-antitoxin system
MLLRIVVDCNVLISLLIGGKLTVLRDHLFSEGVRLFVSERLLDEVLDVGGRSHLARYFDARQLHTFIQLFQALPDEKLPTAVSRDPDDDYLLALCLKAKHTC